MKIQKTRLYLDNGASVKGFKNLHSNCIFVVSPYDHESARRRDVKWELGIHSEVQWNDCNWAWDEDDQPWDGHSASVHLPEIYKIIGKDPNNRRDGLHLDSAYKSKCDAFLTSDKGDIWHHRQTLQELLGYKIFHPLSELEQLEIFIENESLRR